MTITLHHYNVNIQALTILLVVLMMKRRNAVTHLHTSRHTEGLTEQVNSVRHLTHLGKGQTTKNYVITKVECWQRVDGGECYKQL